MTSLLPSCSLYTHAPFCRHLRHSLVQNWIITPPPSAGLICLGCLQCSRSKINLLMHWVDAHAGTEAGSPFVSSRPSRPNSRASSRPAGLRGAEEAAPYPQRASGDRTSAEASTVAARSSYEERVPAAAGRRSPAMLPAAQRDILETWLEY